MRPSLGKLLTIFVCLVLSACADTTDGGDCVSAYDPVATAPTWRGLKEALLDTTERGSVDRVRIQARGDDVGAGNKNAVRVVDLLDQDGERLAQVDVWRTDKGGWTAGIWKQCID
jgi:hypothetical protein